MILSNLKELDKVGRIVISKDIRNKLDIHTGDALEVETEGDRIVIKKAKKSCALCGSTENLTDFKEKAVCDGCLKEIKEL